MQDQSKTWRLFWQLPICFFSLLLLSFDGTAQVNQYKLIGKNAMQSKNFYLLTLFEENVQVKQLLATDKELVKLSKDKQFRLKESLKECRDAVCLTTQMKFSADEIKAISKLLARLCKPDNALDRMVKQQLIPSGTYSLYNGLNPQQLLVKAWQQDAEGINHTIAVYGEGIAPNYPKIDSTTINTSGSIGRQIIADCTATILTKVKGTTLFFRPSLESALLLLAVNNRDNAADNEPTDQTINKAAFERIKSINWKKYKYSLIMVPGAGPDDDQPLSSQGKSRCDGAAKLYFEGVAPFIMTSGGRVHPNKTSYCEAIEMKKYLISNLHVPENAIIAEPQARHTTTNMRNCVRIIYRYGLPDKIPFVVSTDPSQSAYISLMAKRCNDELHYVPYKIGNRISIYAQAFFPVAIAMQINADEPLDP